MIKTVTKLLDDHLILKEQEKQKEFAKEKSMWRASSMGQCYRKRYWDRKGEEKQPFDNRILRVFEVGNILHIYLQKLLKDEGELVSAEEVVENGVVRGHIDAIVRGDKGYIIYDFKTVHSRKFSYLKKGADDHYIKQLMTYTMLAKKKYKNIQDSRLLYISKDDLRMQEMSYQLSDFIENEIKQELADLENYWKCNQLPPAKSKEKWECGWCNYTQCENNKLKKKNANTSKKNHRKK